MKALFEWLLEKILPKLWDTFVPLLYRRRLVVITAVILVLCGGGLIYWYSVRTTRYEEIVLATLKRECYPTPQIYKGLEAFIVSTVPNDLKSQDSFANEPLSPKFCEILRGVPSALAGFKGHAQGQQQPANVLNGLHVAKGNSGILLTDEVANTVLFLPVQVLRPSFTEAERNLLRNGSAEKKEQAALLEKTLKADPYLQEDIKFTAALAPILNNLAETPVTTDPNDRPLQVYIVTKNGLNRISNGSSMTSSAYQFPETTFFPSRPYFWPTFDEIGRRYFVKTLDQMAPPDYEGVGKYFKISRPYMDLAGNGMVVTITRGLLVDNLPRAVLCIDLPAHSSSLYNSVEGRVKTLGGRWVKADCALDQRAHCSATESNGSRVDSEDPLLQRMERELNNRIAHQNLAEIRGNIIVFQEDPSLDSGAIEASLPLRGVEGNMEQFLLISLDFARFRYRTTLIAIVAATLIGIATLLLAYVGGMHAKQSKDYESAFARVAEVMVESPVPYLRLDSGDKIRNFSGSFLDLIKLTPEQATTLSTKTLRSFLADDESKNTYDRVEECRKGQNPVTPYHVRLKRADGQSVRVKIVSAAIPDPGGTGMPDTFGLLLRAAEEGSVHADLVEAAKATST